MTLEKTNVPGFLKDKKSNVIIPTNLDEKVRQVQANRQKFREFQQMKRDIEELKEKVAKLETVIHFEKTLECVGKMSNLVLKQSDWDQGSKVR